jgi:hypothetical protein
MEELHDDALADHHARIQRDRGAHHPRPLPDPFADVDEEPVAPVNGKRRGACRRRAAKPLAPAANGDGATLQLPLDLPAPGDADGDPKG